MCDLDEARDRKEDGFDEEVQEEECDSKTAEKAMPPGTFIGFKECCLGTLGPPVTQNPEVVTFCHFVKLHEKYGPLVPECY